MPSNRRKRSRRRNPVIASISNKTFLIVSCIMLVIIGISVTVIRLRYETESKALLEEKQRISEEIEEIYVTANSEISNLKEHKANSIIRFSAVGDILCGDLLKLYGKDYSNIFTDITKYLEEGDLVLGTYETNVTGETENFAKAIKDCGIDTVSIAHNHSLDLGIEGLNRTDSYLKELGMNTVGIYKDTPEERVLIVERKKIKIAILAYTYDDGDEGVNIYSEELAKADLEYAKQNAAFTIVMMHWGNVNTNYISSKQKEQAQFLCDNGADIIIGAHPSAVQKMEVITNSSGKDCFVAYSIGDFTSDFSNENANLELILNLQVYVDTEGNSEIYRVDYTPIYMFDKGYKFEKNRFKILDMKQEIANYEFNNNLLDKETYDKLVRGIDRLNRIVVKNQDE